MPLSPPSEPETAIASPPHRNTENESLIDATFKAVTVIEVSAADTRKMLEENASYLAAATSDLLWCVGPGEGVRLQEILMQTLAWVGNELY